MAAHEGAVRRVRDLPITKPVGDRPLDLLFELVRLVYGGGLVPDDEDSAEAQHGPESYRIDAIARTSGLGLDEAILARATEVIFDALQGGHQRTRAELAVALEHAGIATDGRLTLLTQPAQADGLVCHALRRRKHYTLTLLDEWGSPTASLPPDNALAELARRYLRSHHPATLQDYAWWSGPTIRDARTGLHAAAPERRRETVNGSLYWSSLNTPPPARAHVPPVAHLLPRYDEYTIGYPDRGAVFDASWASKVDAPHNNILFIDTIASAGSLRRRSGGLLRTA
jgi:hypothetical protein